MENLDIQSTPLLSDYPHTRRTLQLETGTSEKTVRRWIKKAAVTGHKFDNVERFTDAQRELILSYQAQRKAPDVVEAELIEPGAIELHQAEGSNAAAPLMRFELEPIHIELATLDTTAMQQQTAQLEQVAQQGASAIASALTARFNAGISQIIAEQDNLLRGIQAQALNGAARLMSKENAND